MDVVSYKCPNCGGGLSFDIQRRDWRCAFCGGGFMLGDLERDEPGSQAGQEPDIAPPAETYGEDAAAFSCPSCGGRIITDRNTAATFCVYCHNPTVIASRLEDEYRPARLLPFKLEKQTVVDALLKLCRSRPLLPGDFREYARKGEVSGLYVPFWLFDSDVDATLKATAQNITRWGDSNYRYTKTDTFRVERSASMHFAGIPADGSAKMDDRLMEALEPFDYKQMVDFSMQYLSGHFAESYDVDQKDAAKRVMPRMRSGVEQLMRAQVGGYTSYQVNQLSSLPKNTSCEYVMLPVWVLMTRYHDKTYTFAMNGQTGKITGQLPLSWGRFWAWFGGVAAAVTAVVCAGGLLL